MALLKYAEKKIYKIKQPRDQKGDSGGKGSLRSVGIGRAFHG